MRTITSRRGYQLSPFNQFDVSVTTELTDEQYEDVAYRRMVYAQQLLDIELQYRKYLDLIVKVEKEDYKTRSAYVEELTKQAETKIVEYITKGT